jgi:ADP-ribosylglycohydrolase
VVRGGHLDDLHEGLWFTVAGRGDIDTTCAIAGGVIAARTGVAALPPQFRRLQQTSAHPRVRNASRKSSRISQRMRRPRYLSWS